METTTLTTIYIVGSTKFEFEATSFNFFKFDIMGVAMDLESIILNSLDL
jgi:hypothetical protein